MKLLRYHNFFNRKIRGKRSIIINLSSAPLHFNYIRRLLVPLIADNTLQIYIASTFPLPDELQNKIVHIHNPLEIKKIGADVLITVDAGKPVDHHRLTKVIHLPHSIVSTHVIYPEGSFDFFDYIFCVGPHHINELESMFAKRGINKCKLIPSGYGIIDDLMEIPFTETIPPTILFAPSWGPNNSLRVFGTTLVQELLNNFQVIVRPHVMSYYEDMDILDVLKDRFSENPHFFIDRNPDSRFVLSKASLVISDYSGIAFEYAFAYRRPVIFLNSQMKMFNENWSHYLPHPGIEVVNRDLIGVILPDCSSLLATIFEMLSHISIYQEKIDQNEHKMLFYKGIFAEKTYLNLKKVLEENNDENWCNSKN